MIETPSITRVPGSVPPISTSRVGGEIPPPGRLAWRIGERRAGHPVRTAAVVGVAGYAVLTLVLLGVGYVVTHVGAIDRWDESVNWAIAQARTPTLDHLAQLGSYLGETITVIAVAVVSATILAIRRVWTSVSLLAVALLVEVTSFLTTSFVIARPRPLVNPLDPAPPTGSYPSGHTAAAIVLYVTLAAIISGRTRSTAVRVLVWSLALILPAIVGISRFVLGMHHPTDEMGSAIGAYGCLVFALLATQAAVVASRVDPTEERR